MLRCALGWQMEGQLNVHETVRKYHDSTHHAAHAPTLTQLNLPTLSALHHALTIVSAIDVESALHQNADQEAAIADWKFNLALCTRVQLRAPR
jgi:hypothetical protein